ncbi:lipase family alpha/beta hydrolase [Altericista sp. CCNU0014]|uniref:lipase family alpha/beta hydrolase n=1 Tax=Altericista sp. CCNU0014 TaxID=3082949 RepID=UPI00384FD495
MPLPTVILPGYLAAARDYLALEQYLTQAGFPTVTVPLTRQSWWVTLGGRPVTPILSQLDRTIQQVLSQTQADRINLIGHSAGGWISRIYMGDRPYCGQKWAGQPQVSTLMTLGTPHTSQERWTRRNLDFVNTTYPGAFYESVNYVCVAGKAIYGKPSLRPGEWFTYQSYQITGGIGQCWGDGITPVEAAHLEGATNLVLENVRHSPQTSDALDRGQGYRWYGSPEVVSQWIQYLA